MPPSWPRLGSGFSHGVRVCRSVACRYYLLLWRPLFNLYAIMLDGPPEVVFRVGHPYGLPWK